MDFQQLCEIIAETTDKDISLVTENASLVNDLDADSLDMLEIIMRVEDECGIEISPEDVEEIKTVGEAWEKIQAAQ